MGPVIQKNTSTKTSFRETKIKTGQDHKPKDNAKQAQGIPTAAACIRFSTNLNLYTPNVAVTTQKTPVGMKIAANIKANPLHHFSGTSLMLFHRPFMLFIIDSNIHLCNHHNRQKN